MPLNIVTNQGRIPLNYMAQLAFAIGRITPSGVVVLGTSFLVGNGKFATTNHVTGGDDSNLVLVVPRFPGFQAYQDTSEKGLQYINAKIVAIDPFKDICMLASEDVNNGHLLFHLTGTDTIVPVSPVITFGYPHADVGRLVLTRQDTHVGARILIEAGGIKSKHIVLNTQARPGQSGSPVVNSEDISVIGMLIGSYAPGGGGYMSMGGIDPHTLHQTTHVISAEYIKEML